MPLPAVVVIGSINMDLVVQLARLPRPGETVQGREFRQFPGGKGANQAVAAARLGAPCSLVGRVGRDAFGEQLVASLRSCGVDTTHVVATDGRSSGIAVIGVEDSGQNAIAVVAGANGIVTPRDVAAVEDLLSQADVLLLQLEIPLETVEAALRTARRRGVLTVLDPAPAPAAMPPPLFQVDVLCPNESEAETLTGTVIRDLAGAEHAAQQLRRRGVRWPVITLGERGALLCAEDGQCTLVPAFPIQARDTTAAGDAFAAAVGVTLAAGRPWPDAVCHGCAAGALAASRLGAQSAMPTLLEVESLVATAHG